MNKEKDIFRGVELHTLPIVAQVQLLKIIADELVRLNVNIDKLNK